MKGDPAIKTWCNLSDLRLMPGDIERACAWFKQVKGRSAKLIILNPKNEKLAGEAGDNVRVSYCAGVLAWEVWLSASPRDNFVTRRPAIEIEADVANDCNKTQTRPKTPVGRPRVEIPVDSALELEAQGLGLREIAKKLGVSHMKISRELRKAKVM